MQYLQKMQDLITCI